MPGLAYAGSMSSRKRWLQPVQAQQSRTPRSAGDWQEQACQADAVQHWRAQRAQTSKESPKAMEESIPWEAHLIQGQQITRFAY
jgi:hypothetical protein